MDIKENFNLAQLTTFRLGGPAKFYCVAQNLDELREAIGFAEKKNLAMFILGGGSNLVVSDSGFAGLVIKIEFRGIEILNDNEQGADFKVGAGEVWDDVVALGVLKDLWGIENLSGIPGQTGAIPIQNVGAYGQEASQTVQNVEVLDLQELETKNLSLADCGFDYRRSNFNTIWKNRFVVLNVTFRLSRAAKPNLKYIDVKNYFAALANPNPGLSEIRQAIIAIRSKKFPDLTEFGCAGSCFKNLILTPEEYLRLEQNVAKNFALEVKNRLIELKHRFAEEGRIKIPAAFLIDSLGLKNRAVGGAKLWENQALVIVNTGQARASDVAELFRQVRQEVYSKTGMQLQSEPEWVGFNQEELDKYFKL